MFSAPLSLTTDTAFELPSYLHESGIGNAWVEANLGGRDVSSYLDAPCFDAKGNLWVVDIPFGRIFRITPTGEWDLIVKYDGWPSGLCFHPDGRLIIADARHGLLALEVDERRIKPFLTHYLSQRFKGVKNIIFAGNGSSNGSDNGSNAGDCYFTDCGQTGLQDATGAAYRLKTDGSVQRLLDNIPGPQGLALNHDESILFIAAAGDNAIWQAPLVDNGVSRVGKFIQMSGGMGAGAGPNGIVADSDNHLFVAHNGLGTVWQFDKRGEPKYRIDSSRGDWTNSLAFDPNDPRNIFITEAQTGSVLKATLPMY